MSHSDRGLADVRSEHFRRDPSFRTAPWYSLMTAPIRFAATPVWARVYKQSLGVRLLKDLAVAAWKRGDTAFVLGSGPSINDLVEAQWAQIRGQTSIGFNWWLHHPHVPDLYVFENVSERHRLLLAERAADYEGIPLLLKQFLTNFSPSKHRARLGLLRTLPESLRRNIYLSSDLLVPGRSEDELRRWVRNVDRLGLMRPKDRFQWVPKRTSSLAFLVALCVRAGFRRIVLCGVDLNRPGYFFDDAGASSAAASVGSDGPFRLHETEDPKIKVLTISQVLSVLTTEVLAPKGVRLEVAHPGSALAAVIPVYGWSDGGTP